VDKYYVSIKTAKGSEVSLSSGPLTLEEAERVEQEINSRLVNEPFACKGKWPDPSFGLSY
jgi:hypothetical protein